MKEDISVNSRKGARDIKTLEKVSTDCHYSNELSGHRRSICHPQDA